MTNAHDGTSDATTDPDHPGTPAAADDRLRQLADDVAHSAAAIAVTEDQVADVREQIAADNPARADTLLPQAREAREFAEHERAEHQRWKRVADD